MTFYRYYLRKTDYSFYIVCVCVCVLEKKNILGQTLIIVALLIKVCFSIILCKHHSSYLIIEAIFIRSPRFFLNKDHDKATVICRKACSDRKPRNTCSIRHFLYLSSHSRTSRIDHGVLMKYA